MTHVIQNIQRKVSQLLKFGILSFEGKGFKKEGESTKGEYWVGRLGRCFCRVPFHKRSDFACEAHFGNFIESFLFMLFSLFQSINKSFENVNVPYE